MEIFFNKSFIKQYKKLPHKRQSQFRERLKLLQINREDRLLNLHKVDRRGDVFISMNVTGDYRALFLWEDKDRVRFYNIGTHSQLYG